MIRCKELKKDFTSKEEMFTALKESKKELISLKKSAVKFSDPNGLTIVGKSDAIKSLKPKTEIEYGSYVYPIINTTKYMDSHGDVHLDGIWNKSAKEQSGKTYLLINHELSVGKVIAQPKDVEVMVKSIPWKDLGRDYDGNTEALIFKAKLTERSNKDGFLAYKENDPVEHSVRMQYVKIDLAINSDDEDFEVEKALWDAVYPQIANKEVADESGYFWAVSEAKIFKEGSMVLAGSNDATPTLYDIEPSKDTQEKEEAAQGTSSDLQTFYEHLRF